jgi:predicted P-loop ATPase
MARPPIRVVADTAWRTMLRRSTNGNPIADVRNVLIILRNEPGFNPAFAFDEMQQAVRVLENPLICADARHNPLLPRYADPEDVTRLQEWLQQVALPRLGREHVENALDEFARAHPVHPIRNWLSSAAWDGTPRLAAFLHKGLGTPDDDYHRQIGAMFLIAMAARVFAPGCQSDYMIVLEGPQGEEKSKFCRLLAGDEYFSDHLPKLEGDQVRVSMHMRGKWLIEISELSAFSKAEAGALKAFITRREEIYTPKYGRKERREPRQCLFIGTTNDDEYIRDDTGGRRFWPVKVARVDLAWLSTHRTQLFAEAVQAYHDGKPSWPSREFEKSVIAPKQEDRQVSDSWTDRVREARDVLSIVTIAAIWEHMSGTNGSDLTRLDMVAQKRIASILKRDGWFKIKGNEGRVTWRNPESTRPFRP